MIMAGLGALVARRFLRMPHLSGFTVRLWTRFSRAVPRFYRALTQPPAKARAPRTRAPRTDAARARPPALPSARAWLTRELGWEAATYMLHLEGLLAEPETQAMLAQWPSAARILRPFCRMLGVPVAAAMPRATVPALCEPVAAASVSVSAESVEYIRAPTEAARAADAVRDGMDRPKSG